MTPLSTNILGTKADTLMRLRPLVKRARIESLVSFTVGEWKTDQKKILSAASEHFGDERLIVRSSALTEDTLESSNAGRFTSVADVILKDEVYFCSAVERVIQSYQDTRTDHQVFVQRFLNDVQISGVAFTRNKDTLAPYMTINYDETSGRTDIITAGSEGEHKTLVIYKGPTGNIREPKFPNKHLEKIYNALREVEEITKHDALDIEFCYKDGEVFILQVRPIANTKKFPAEQEIMIGKALTQIAEKIEELSRPHPHLYGKQTAFGNMPDWNPAEMIGIRPRPLALSLYKELITDNIWAYQRDNYGYKNLRSFPLMVSFAGQPYIDIRVSFNSFIPKSLDDNLSHKLADYYISKLLRTPTSHDKVEFDIVFSCYTLDLDTRLQELREHDFSAEEIGIIKQALLELTNTIIQPDGLYKKDYKKVLQLEKRRNDILGTELSDVSKIYWLIEDCKRYGTLPFAGLARTAFIATQFLNSMVDLGILSAEERAAFLRSVETVAKKLSQDTMRFAHKKITLDEFLAEYGHLRPGTYDILSKSYQESPDKYFDFENITASDQTITDVFQPTTAQNKAIATLLKKHGLKTTVDEFWNFLREAIEWRELAKFIFTKSVNEILRLTREYGSRFDLSAEDMSYISIHSIMKRYTSIAFVDEKNVLTHAINHNKEMHRLYAGIVLPHLIRTPDEIYTFYLSEIKPNFVTLGSAEAEVCVVDAKIERPNGLRGKIVCIESADPGFDWIFSHGIAGLITMHGGANSHMAVRAAELNIPAVIGCGSVHFEKWRKAKRLAIDAANEKVTIIS